MLSTEKIKIKHRHQRCKAPTQPMQNILYHEYFRLKEAGQKKYLSQRLSHNFFLTTSYSQRHSHNVFLLRLSHAVALTYSSTCVVLTAPQYTRNLSVRCKYLKISQIRQRSDPLNFDIFWSIKLKPRRCTPAIYIHALCEVSEP